MGTRDILDYDFFISFSNADLEIVSPIVNMMCTQYGAKCWFQEKDSRAEFIDAIMDGIEHSNAFIIFVSPSSANSYFVLNEINHAVEWRNSHDNYKIVPVVIGPPDIDINNPVYRKINFYLGRLNMCFYRQEESLEVLIRKIFDQAEYEVVGEALHKSLYHTSDIEAKRLSAQNEILRDFSREYFLKYVRPEMHILDVGCADGSNICMRLDGIDYAALLGVDIDEGQINKANEQYGSEKNKFIACDVLHNSFDDIISDYVDDNEITGFDIIHVSAVLLHLSEPIKLLHLLRRFLKKNGYIFIQDEDDGANLVYPNSLFFDRAFAIWADSKESGDRHCARKIPYYLLSAGYKRLLASKCGVSNVGLSLEKQTALWDIYFNYHLWLAAEENVFYNVAKTNKMLDEYRKEYDERKKEYDEGEIFIQLGFFFFIAQK